MKKRVALIICISIILSVSTAFAASRTALVIGNSNYKASPLPNPVNDAVDMAAVLKKLGFDVILKKDADKKEMISGLRSFGRKLSGAEIGLFYYAGHGMQINGTNYLIPVNCNIRDAMEVEFEAIDAGRILARMEGAGNPMNIVILDACRDNPFKRSFRTAEKGLAKMDAPPGTVIAYATSPGSTAEDGKGRNGTYTAALLRYLQQPGLDVQRMFNMTGLAVMQQTGKEQVPWLSTTPFEEYYLNGKGSTAKRPAAVPEKKPVVQQAPAATRNDASMDMDALLAQAASEKAVKEKKQREYQARLDKEMARKLELEALIEKYETLVKQYGEKYKVPAWQAICSEFPVLTDGLKTGDVSSLKMNASGIKTGGAWTDPTTGIEFVWVPKGCFQMGSTTGDADEKPVHEVCVDGFWMGKYEVTIDEFRKYLMETGNTTGVDFSDGNCPIVRDGSYSLRNNKFGKNGRQPMVEVSWYGAKAFADWLSKKGSGKFRLPTEAEWEYAARSGGKNETYAGSNNADEVAWYGSNSGGDTTHPVGQKKENGLGVFDMSGNVWEWCEDLYVSDVYNKHSQNNPLVAFGNSVYVNRGGGFPDSSKYLRCSDRDLDKPNETKYHLGFRIVKVP